MTNQQRNNEAGSYSDALTQLKSIAPQIDTPIVKEDIVPLNYELAFKSYSQEEQQEIIALADSIDVTKIDNVMQYGSQVAQMAFSQAGEFLKRKRGTQADREVINQVIELSKKASQAREDFNLALKEPNLLQKIFLNLTTKSGSQIEKIQACALTNYDLMSTLYQSYEKWIEMLKNTMDDIDDSGLSDLEVARLLEKYIISGRMAQDRVEKEMESIKEQHEETGLQTYSNQYNELSQGYNIFLKRLSVLEDFLTATKLSLGQLVLTKKGNTDLQTFIYTEKDLSVSTMAQQLRNAVLNAENRQVLDGHKAVKGLNNELIKDVSKACGLTAEETENLFYKSLFDINSAKESIQMVIDSCEKIKKIAEENLPKLKQGHQELDEMLDKLGQYIDPITKQQTLQNNATSTNVVAQENSSSKVGALKF